MEAEIREEGNILRRTSMRNGRAIRKEKWATKKPETKPSEKIKKVSENKTTCKEETLQGKVTSGYIKKWTSDKENWPIRAPVMPQDAKYANLFVNNEKDLLKKDELLGKKSIKK